MSPDPKSAVAEPAAPTATPTEVFAVHGAEPEVQAYAMAKYSRSALSMKESLAEISEQKAEKFLNTFYFQYGHRSIADLAHIALAIERLSMIAAIILVDEQRWDGQERSTRYQDFQRSGYYVPGLGGDAAALKLYRETADSLFAEYQALSPDVFRYLADRTPRPAEMKQESYDRTLKARAFDITRYLLPLATNTSLGQIVNARTLETQVSRLLASPFAEVRLLGEKLKKAATEAAYNINQAAFADLVRQIRDRDAALADRAEALLLKPVRSAPTLVKYADPCQYDIATRTDLARLAAELLANEPIEPAATVDLLDDEPLEVELATTLLYEHCHYPYRQIRRHVAALAAARRQEIIELAAARHRGRHDELLRPFAAGQKFRFDILMDVGGFRDLHRHRRCIQIQQGFTALHGYDTPDDITAAGLGARYAAAIERASAAAGKIAALPVPEAAQSAAYLLPLASRKRTLFKMDFSEAVYIAELRTGPAGHFSYRNVAYAMYEAVAQRYPALAPYFRVTDVREPVDLLKR